MICPLSEVYSYVRVALHSIDHHKTMLSLTSPDIESSNVTKHYQQVDAMSYFARLILTSNQKAETPADALSELCYQGHKPTRLR